MNKSNDLNRIAVALEKLLLVFSIQNRDSLKESLEDLKFLKLSNKKHNKYMEASNE